MEGEPIQGHPCGGIVRSRPCDPSVHKEPPKARYFHTLAPLITAPRRHTRDQRGDRLARPGPGWSTKCISALSSDRKPDTQPAPLAFWQAGTWRMRRAACR